MQRIIFFDGICLLCNSFVNYVFNNDNKHQFKYSALQSKTAFDLLPQSDLKLDSIVYFEDNKTYKRSTAVLRIMFHLGGAWPLISVTLAIIPTPIRDFIYNFVAKNRYQVFGKSETCRLPTPEEKQYFLD
ncbi:MAG: DCC1-like thiol-disulfide oxidoreductase family protein [Pseudobdellovibrio sp.]